jgi:hypothetical protein
VRPALTALAGLLAYPEFPATAEDESGSESASDELTNTRASHTVCPALTGTAWLPNGQVVVFRNPSVAVSVQGDDGYSPAVTGRIGLRSSPVAGVRSFRTYADLMRATRVAVPMSEHLSVGKSPPTATPLRVPGMVRAPLLSVADWTRRTLSASK